MTTKPDQIIPPIRDEPHAPFVYFDEAPNFGHTNGVVNFSLATYRHILNSDGSVRTDLVVVGHMRCGVAGAVALRAALDKALLAAAPAPEQVN